MGRTIGQIVKAVAWGLAAVFAGLVLLALYAPGQASRLMRSLNIDLSGAGVVIWAAFIMGALIVLAAFVGSLKGARLIGRRGGGKNRN